MLKYIWCMSINITKMVYNCGVIENGGNFSLFSQELDTMEMIKFTTYLRVLRILLFECLSICSNKLIKILICPCADPEIFMRGGPTKMVIFCHRRGGVQPPKNPEITFF